MSVDESTSLTRVGATNPAASEPGTIRGDFCIEVGRNVIHGSDAVESAQKEIALWFPEGASRATPLQHDLRLPNEQR
jgi:nucleoside-diphosphate kinase